MTAGLLSAAAGRDDPSRQQHRRPMPESLSAVRFYCWASRALLHESSPDTILTRCRTSWDSSLSPPCEVALRCLFISTFKGRQIRFQHYSWHNPEHTSTLLADIAAPICKAASRSLHALARLDQRTMLQAWDTFGLLQQAWQRSRRSGLQAAAVKYPVRILSKARG